jgi:hypothetical protein
VPSFTYCNNNTFTLSLSSHLRIAIAEAQEHYEATEKLKINVVSEHSFMIKIAVCDAKLKEREHYASAVACQ